MGGMAWPGMRYSFTAFTLALLKDSGWYDVDMTTAGYVEYGRGRGCSFLTTTPSQYAADNPGYFCPTEHIAGCTSDFRSKANCRQVNPIRSAEGRLGRVIT